MSDQPPSLLTSSMKGLSPADSSSLEFKHFPWNAFSLWRQDPSRVSPGGA